MDLVTASIRNPIKVAVAVLLVALFGILALLRIPIQLTPDVAQPQVTIETRWPGASPQEVEREIIEEQEEQLKSVEGVRKMSSEAMDSMARIILEFAVGTDLSASLLKVSNRLNQVREYPEDADEPVISTTNLSDRPIAWFMLRPIDPASGIVIDHLRKFAEDFVEARLERVNGVTNSNVLGGQEKELQVTIDPQRLAARGVTVEDLRVALLQENRDTSAGDFWEGKRRYVVRTLGQFESTRQVEDIIVRRDLDAAVYVRDVASVQVGYRKPDGIVRQKGVATLAINALMERGANILKVMDGIRDATRELNEGVLQQNGLVLQQVYDETDYIKSAVSLVTDNIYIGGALTIIVLLGFLHPGLRTLLFAPAIGAAAIAAASISPWFFAIVLVLVALVGLWYARAALVIALAIPISIVGTFLLVTSLGRSLNVISLAGLAFAVGMVVDNAIVVLENIYRRHELGEGTFEAASRGTKEVWGAVVSSTLTTLAVFIPVVFVEEEAGQLFRDIAIAISCAVGLSLIVSVTVIPAAAARLLAGTRKDGARSGPGEGRADSKAERRPGPVTRLARVLVNALLAFHKRLQGSTPGRLGTVTLFVAGSILLSLWTLPKPEYLPEGNRNLTIGILLPPPAYNLAHMKDIGREIEAKLVPYWSVREGSPEAAQLDGPPLEHFFFVARGRQLFMGSRSQSESRAREVAPILRKALAGIPGMLPVVTQASLFEQNIVGGRSVDIEITGPSMERLVAIGTKVFLQVMQLIPDGQSRPVPSLDLSSPELHVVPRPETAAEMKLRATEIGYAVNALVDGAYAGDYFDEGDKIDVVIKGADEYASRTQDIGKLSIATRSGELLPLEAVADVVLSSGPEQINHRERRRAITIQVKPPERMPLGEAVELIVEKVVQPLRESGEIQPPYDVALAGTADKLTLMRKTFGGDWTGLNLTSVASVLTSQVSLVVMITYLLMAALFESWLYPFVIMVSVPFAAAGGILGLWLLNAGTSVAASLTGAAWSPQKLDTLTMLGFVILVGTVVNNAILIVHQALVEMREAGVDHRVAVIDSVRTRVRPIFMTAGTTVLGLLPLVVFPGPGSELYRGLGSVVLGGLVVSTLFTLILVPALFTLTLEARESLARLWRGGRESPTAQPDRAP